MNRGVDLNGAFEGSEIDELFGQAKELNNSTRKKYQEFGQSMPSDAAQKVNKVSLYHMYTILKFNPLLYFL